MFAPKNILVATDFSEPAKCVLRYAKEMAAENKAMIHVVHTVEMIEYPTGLVYPGMENILNEERAVELSDRALGTIASELDTEGFSVTTETLRNGDAADGISDYAKSHDIDLICIATHGRSGLGHFFLGSTTERLLRKTYCPVLVVRRKED
ncbi:MAG: universal stress protein [Bacteroidota bacterium]